MEEQAATMMISLVGKGAETTVKLAGKSIDVLAKMAAFLLSLWQKSSQKGQVTMAKLLKSGGPLSAITMDRENFEKFVGISKGQMVPYHAAYRADNDSYLVTLKSDDLQRVKTAFDFWSISATEIKNVNGVSNPAIDSQPEAAEGDLLQPNEMRISDFDNMVEQNKDNSEEMRMVHGRFWPMLKQAGQKRVSVVSETEYDTIRKAAPQEGILFAPCVKNGEILLAYQAKDTERVGQLIGRELPYKNMVSEAALQQRQAERERKAEASKLENAEKGDSAIVSQPDVAQSDVAQPEAAQSDVAQPEAAQVADGDLLQPNEMRLSDFDNMVERNKDNSDEMRIVHDTHWPTLEQAGPKRVSIVSEPEYEAFKKAAPKEGILFAPCVKNGEIMLAYQAKDTERVGQIIGRELPYKNMVSDAALQQRQAERELKAEASKIENAEKGDSAIVSQPDVVQSDVAQVAEGDILQPNEMRISDFDNMVERNKDTSDEMRIVHDTHWPTLEQAGPKRVSIVSEAEYEAFKKVAPKVAQVAEGDLLQPNEMRISDFDNLVEQNKDNSEEMRMVHDKHWPTLEQAEPKRVSIASEAEYKAFKKVEPQEGILFALCVKNGEFLLAYQAKDTERVGLLIGRELPYKQMVSDAELQNRQVERDRKANTPKIENVNKDEKADFRMDEQDAREAQALKNEVEGKSHEAYVSEQTDSFDFAARKQEVVRQNEGVDFEGWQKTAKPGEKPPANLNLCLRTDQAVFDQVAKAEKADKLNEAKAVQGLKAQKVNQIAEKMPKVKGKDIGLER